MANRWVKFRWQESRGDQYAHWGPSTWFLEVDADTWPVRQVEVYDSGPSLRYGPGHEEDEYGALGQARVSDADDNWPFVWISSDEFEAAWRDDQ